MIPFKTSTINDRKFRNRQIMALEIPTYDSMKKVMFYDVLMKLCHQSIKLFYEKEEVQKNRMKMKIVRMLNPDLVLYCDSLEALHNT